MLAEREQQHQGGNEDVDRDDECMRQLKAIRALLETVTWRVLLVILIVVLVHLFPRRISEMPDPAFAVGDRVRVWRHDSMRGVRIGMATYFQYGTGEKAMETIVTEH